MTRAGKQDELSYLRPKVQNRLKLGPGQISLILGDDGHTVTAEIGATVYQVDVEWSDLDGPGISAKEATEESWRIEDHLVKELQKKIASRP